MWQHHEAFALSQLGGQGKRVACRGQRPGMLRTARPRNRKSSGSGVHRAKVEPLVTGCLVKSSEDQSRLWPVNSGSPYCSQSQGHRDQNHRYQFPWQIIPGSKSPKDLCCFRGSRSRDCGQRPWPASPCASTTWHGIRNTGSGQRGRKRGERAASSKRGPWLTPPGLSTQHCFWHLAAIADFTNKPPDGALSGPGARPPSPLTPSLAEAHGLLTKHLSELGAGAAPLGWHGGEKDGHGPETPKLAVQQGSGTHGRKQAGGFCGGDLGAWGTPGSGPEHRRGSMLLETVNETTYSSPRHALEQGAGGREGGGRGLSVGVGAPPRP